MQKIFIFLTIVFTFHSALAFNSRKSLTDHSDDVLSSRNRVRGLQVDTSNGYFCILSDSGGGDSGGGIWPQNSPIKKPWDPAPDDEGSSNYPYEDFSNDKYLGDDEYLEISMGARQEPFFSAQNLAYNVLEYLSCDTGRGIPVSAKDELLFILRGIVSEGSEAEEDGYNLQLIENLIAVLISPEEV